ncbi:MAG TPA: formylglycine-generating enzyme family protein [Acidobacteriota bacterium]|nr:formylglycine-generating enzyme family protein [Acidobacteriota bacterium]
MKLRSLMTVICGAAMLAACADRQTAGDVTASAPRTHDLVLIPGGEFVMGKDGEGDYSPAHTVRIDSFYIDRYEVTSAQYFEFCESTGAKLPEFWEMGVFNSGPDYQNHPVVGVSWGDAKAYAEWRGMRLPTEAEWEYAGRGGLVGMSYPTGDEIDSSTANYTIEGVATGTVPVGSYPPNGFGLHDMSGNVSEWVADYYDGDYYAVAPVDNPTGPEKGKFRVFRGGGWHSGPFCNRVYFRNALPSNFRDYNLGFRCARNLHPLASAD